MRAWIRMIYEIKWEKIRCSLFLHIITDVLVYNKEDGEEEKLKPKP